MLRPTTPPPSPPLSTASSPLTWPSRSPSPPPTPPPPPRRNRGSNPQHLHHHHHADCQIWCTCLIFPGVPLTSTKGSPVHLPERVLAALSQRDEISNLRERGYDRKTTPVGSEVVCYKCRSSTSTRTGSERQSSSDASTPPFGDPLRVGLENLIRATAVIEESATIRAEPVGKYPARVRLERRDTLVQEDFDFRKKRVAVAVTVYTRREGCGCYMV